jgi:hypothetical protein
MTAQLLQLAASLAAILFVTLIAWKIGLGGDVRLRDAGHARQLASDLLYGFEPVDVAMDRAGIGALLRDAGGRIMVLRRHGVHFVARLLDSHAGVRLDHNFLTITAAERRFGSITLDLGANAQIWVGSLRRLGN